MEKKIEFVAKNVTNKIENNEMEILGEKVTLFEFFEINDLLFSRIVI